MQEKIAEFAGCLRQGGVVVFPTETVYALAADPTNPESVARIYALKGRLESKPLAVFFSSLSAVEPYVDFNESARMVMRCFMPGPITCILSVKEGCNLASNLMPREKTLGVRIPDHPFAMGLLHAFGRPIAATSVNRSGEPAATNAESVKRFCAKEIPFYAVSEKKNALIRRSSTVVDLSNEAPVLLREGGIDFDKVRSFY